MFPQSIYLVTSSLVVRPSTTGGLIGFSSATVLHVLQAGERQSSSSNGIRIHYMPNWTVVVGVGPFHSKETLREGSLGKFEGGVHVSLESKAQPAQRSFSLLDIFELNNAGG
mmetsp:Transcript_33827/g.100945  ORF Transcript_33827/g.100945 Transcript_33827/m.100945 type:complete len:112 (-) Transcript_33827:55-390(-)